MSTADTGDREMVAAIVADAKAMVEGARVEAAQLDLLEPVTPEEMLEAREALGPNAGKLAVLQRARETKRGRPKGSRNKRTDDFARYLLSFGQHPAITMMQIQATPPEVLQANSRRRVTKVITGAKGAGDKVIEIEEETLTYEGAQSLRLRASEGLMPYLESKKPVAVDLSFNGISDLMIEGVTHTRGEMDDFIEGDFMPIDDEGGEAPE